MSHHERRHRAQKHEASNIFEHIHSFFSRFVAADRKRAVPPTAKLAIELLETRHLLAAQFFAPAVPSGSVNVQLVPLANVAAGTQEIVTFGVPLTRGSVNQAQLAQVRVLKNGVEVPAFVEQLTPRRETSISRGTSGSAIDRRWTSSWNSRSLAT
jgi:hypothetical protein